MNKVEGQVKKPICEKCKKECSPAGGLSGEVTTLWKCFKCNYEVEDVAVLVFDTAVKD